MESELFFIRTFAKPFPNAPNIFSFQNNLSLFLTFSFVISKKSVKIVFPHNEIGILFLKEVVRLCIFLSVIVTFSYET